MIITFDDGYADNYEQPSILGATAQAVFFSSTDYIGTNPFWFEKIPIWSKGMVIFGWIWAVPGIAGKWRDHRGLARGPLSCGHPAAQP